VILGTYFRIDIQNQVVHYILVSRLEMVLIRFYIQSIRIQEPHFQLQKLLLRENKYKDVMGLQEIHPQELVGLHYQPQVLVEAVRVVMETDY